MVHSRRANEHPGPRLRRARGNPTITSARPAPAGAGLSVEPEESTPDVKPFLDPGMFVALVKCKVFAEYGRR
eukprot:gene9576-18909_t